MDQEGVEPCHIAQAELVRVSELVRSARRCATEADVRAVILNDRPAGGEYQRWLDTAWAPLLAEYVLAQLPVWPGAGRSSAAGLRPSEPSFGHGGA
jgi:hypothetical protein